MGTRAEQMRQPLRPRSVFAEYLGRKLSALLDQSLVATALLGQREGNPTSAVNRLDAVLLDGQQHGAL